MPSVIPNVKAETYPRPELGQAQEAIVKRALQRKILYDARRSSASPEHNLFGFDIEGVSGIEIKSKKEFWNSPVVCICYTGEPVTKSWTQSEKDYLRELLQFHLNANQAVYNFAFVDKGEEVLDWDAHIKVAPPPRHSGTLAVRFRYAGRSRPMSIDSPRW